MTARGVSPYPDDCSGPPDDPEYDGPEIEAAYDLDRARWEATCPSCGQIYGGRREEYAVAEAQNCWTWDSEQPSGDPREDEDRFWQMGGAR